MPEWPTDVITTVLEVSRALATFAGLRSLRLLPVAAKPAVGWADRFQIVISTRKHLGAMD
jgi:hypothetical protein